MGVVHLENEHLELHFPNPLAMREGGEGRGRARERREKRRSEEEIR